MSQLLHFFHCHHQLCPFSIFIITTKMITTRSFIHFQRGTLCAKGTFGPSHKVPPICYCLGATTKNIITLKFKHHKGHCFFTFTLHKVLSICYCLCATLTNYNSEMPLEGGHRIIIIPLQSQCYILRPKNHKLDQRQGCWYVYWTRAWVK